MNRRNFLRQSAALSAGFAYLPACTTFAAVATPNYPMGYQLFSVRDVMVTDPVGTLRALKAMGYSHFEVYGYQPEDDLIYGFSAADFRGALDDLELSVTSGHFGFSLDLRPHEVDRYTDGCIKGAKAMGLDYLVWPFLPPGQRDLESFQRLCPYLNRIGERVTAAGLGFAFHNNGYEWQRLADGHFGYDIVRAETDAKTVKLQLDMYWVTREGETTPRAVIDVDPERVVMWHIKDMHKISRDYTELGNGSIDYAAILTGLDVSGLKHLYLEQGGNFTVDSMTSAHESSAFYKAKLQGLV